MKILVIGGSGFIGPYLIRELISLGNEVAVFNRGNNRINIEGIKEITGDITDLAKYKPEFQRFAPDVVIHMIAYSEQDALAAMSTFAGLARRMIVISSMDVYLAYGIITGLEELSFIPMPLSEGASLRQKLYPYGGEYEKILVEQAVLSDSENLPCTVLRLPMVYGPGDPSHRLYKYMKRKQDKRSLIVFDTEFAEWHVSRGYVENVAHAITLAALNDQAMNRIYNVGEEAGYSEKEWLQRIASAIDWNVKIDNYERSGLPDVLRSSLNIKQDWVLDTSLIRAELNYFEIVDREEALRRTTQWEANHPPKQLHPREFPLFNYEAEDLFVESQKNARSKDENENP